MLRIAIASGDWETARSATELLGAAPLPPAAPDLGDRVAALLGLLNAARAARAHLAMSLARVEAASRFQEPSPERQNLVDTTSF